MRYRNSLNPSLSCSACGRQHGLHWPACWQQQADLSAVAMWLVLQADIPGQAQQLGSCSPKLGLATCDMKGMIHEGHPLGLGNRVSFVHYSFWYTCDFTCSDSRQTEATALTDRQTDIQTDRVIKLRPGRHDSPCLPWQSCLPQCMPDT